ncbi:phosphotransferase [Pseudogemmobacter sonorensis]|uniref:phosphotransferase n=1 Tax=Pseudogemmobacter sonorensis TaxID=2989681 RepID=UPI003691CE73
MNHAPPFDPRDGDILRHPALRDCGDAIPLSGFSGATIALIPDGPRSFVRKASNSRAGNAGLRGQALRQQRLAGLVAGCAAMPEVLDMGERDGYFYFDMEFVPSRDAINFLSNSGFHSVADFADRVERLMIRLAETPAPAPTSGPAPLAPSKALVEAKLDQIAARTLGAFGAELAPLRAALARIDRLAAPGGATAVHGDLTFENILVDRHGALWLIDTIASPFDHFAIDWSKLFQECEGLWHAHRGRPLARGVTWWLRQRFHRAATLLDPGWPQRHYIHLGLTFARILPYVKTDEDRSFVGRRVAECGRAALETLSQRS